MRSTSPFQVDGFNAPSFNNDGGMSATMSLLIFTDCAHLSLEWFMVSSRNCHGFIMKKASGIVALNSLGFQGNMEGRHCKVWDGLHVSPRLAPSKGAKLCTYLAWFFCQGQ